jgi:hypothetical protein
MNHNIEAIERDTSQKPGRYPSVKEMEEKCNLTSEVSKRPSSTRDPSDGPKNA